MTSNLATRPCANVLFNEPPVFAEQSQTIHKTLVLCLGPSSVLGEIGTLVTICVCCLRLGQQFRALIQVLGCEILNLRLRRSWSEVIYVHW